MPTVILIAPDHLDPAAFEEVRARVGGGEPIWRHPGRAAEFPVTGIPDGLDGIMAEVRAGGVDIAVLPAGERRKDVLIADMDSTMIGQECIDELADFAGVGPQVAAITGRAMNGELDFEGALRERVGLLQGMASDVVERVWQERITLMPGGRTLVATMRAHGAYAALISGGFTQFTSRAARALGFDVHRANVLIERDGVLTGEVADPILGRAAKVAALEEICAARGVPVGGALAVGDGANDLGMIERAGLGVALHAKPVVAGAAQVRIDHNDLSALLFLQGYHAEEFVL